MTPFAADLLVLFRRDLGAMAREVTLFPDDAALWQTMPGIANPGGNLALHVAGNLRHFVGAVLGGTDYLRDREAEFGRRTGARSEVTADLNAALATLEAVLPTLSAATLSAPFPIAVAGIRPPTSRFLLHLAAHLAFHLGQIGYLRRTLTGDSQSAGAMAIPDLAQP
jgi:uncharacterized damage-inducible protein DinB